MLLLLSPAKTLDFSSKLPLNLQTSKPIFLNEARELVTILQNYNVEEISKLMKISAKLADLNLKRFQEFSTSENRPAIFAYKGDVYEGFELAQYTEKELEFATNHLRIISGLYGVLKPLDLIQAYRLEMNTNLLNTKGKNLYSYWQEKITEALNQEETDFIVNLASQEYSAAILESKLLKPFINIAFKERYNNSYKVVGIHAKKARGMMANFIIRNHIFSFEELKKFKGDNYQFSPQLSSKNEYVFIR